MGLGGLDLTQTFLFHQAKPCAFKKGSWQVRRLLEVALQACPDVEAAVCGSLVCRPKKRRFSDGPKWISFGGKFCQDNFFSHSFD
jgi:hypothetical protein